MARGMSLHDIPEWLRIHGHPSHKPFRASSKVQTYGGNVHYGACSDGRVFAGTQSEIANFFGIAESVLHMAPWINHVSTPAKSQHTTSGP